MPARPRVEAWNIQHPALQKALHEADTILTVINSTRARLLEEQKLEFNHTNSRC